MYIDVRFDVKDQDTLERVLQKLTEHDDGNDVVGYRIGDQSRRDALDRFSSEMERKLRKNDHKSSWMTLPIVALFRLLRIEIEEFSVALEFQTVAEARRELVDIANYAMILDDRLSVEEQDACVSIRS